MKPANDSFAMRLSALRAQVDDLHGNWRALTDDNRDVRFNALKLQCDLVCEAAIKFGVILPAPARDWRERVQGNGRER